MNKLYTIAFLSIITLSVKAQTPAAVPAAQPYGVVSLEDLQMKECDFEKDANAEMLFATADVYYGADLNSISADIHKRIKIFNDNGKSAANIKIEFFTEDRLEYITGIQAETINMVDGKQVITKVDKKLIYTKNVDKLTSEVTFTFPDVKAGSVLEYKYTWNTISFANMPDWYFQERMPVRYSELRTAIPDVFYFRPISHLRDPYVKYTTKEDGRSLQDGSQAYPYTLKIETRALANIQSLQDEPFMSSFNDYVQSLRFQLVSIKPIGGFQTSHSDTWAKVGGRLADDDDFGGQLKRKLNGEEAIIAKAKTFKTDDQKIAYVFNEVKKSMKWNGEDTWYTNDGTYRAWENKIGNSTEINLILYHLLKQSGVYAYPMVVSTKQNGKINSYYTSLAQFNRGVVYIPVDSAKAYVLDASGKYNLYDEMPADLLNSQGLYIDKSKNQYDFFFLKQDLPERQAVSINAEIKPGGKLEGIAQISGTNYYRTHVVEKYKTDGEKKYIEYLQDGDNNLKIASLTMDNMEVDTLPLTQKVNFSLDMAGSDETYIYLNANLFTSLKANPFLSENRMTDIDFMYPRNYSINGVFKIPAGYKADALPKNVSMVMPDKSFGFKRLVVEQDGAILVRYNIAYNVAEYSKENYPDMREFFKKMIEMLNEQVVLKKI